MTQSYKNAMNCRKCPGNNGPNGCPVWVEYTLTNAQGELKTEAKCGHQAWPVFMVEVIKASNRPAAAVESTRNALIKSLTDIARASVIAAAALEVTDRADGEVLHRLASSSRVLEPPK